MALFKHLTARKLATKFTSLLTQRRVIVGILVAASVLLCTDLLSKRGIPTTFDGHIHLTTAVQYANLLKHYEVPAWFQGFANYGYPLSLIAHQTNAYLGAALLLLDLPPDGVFKILILFSTLVSSLGFFWYLKTMLASIEKNGDRMAISALVGSLVWTFSHYRIINIYSRGAIPELLASAVLPLLLLSCSRYLIAPTSRALLAVIGLTGTLALTHPMMLVTALPAILAGVLLAWSKQRESLVNMGYLALAGGLGVLLAAYYLLPLQLELKYFYQGMTKPMISPDQFLSWRNALVGHWPYFSSNDHPGPRVGLLPFGLIETGVWVLAAGLLLRDRLKRRRVSKPILVWFLGATVALLFMIPLSQPLYRMLPLLGGLQFPWRFLLSFHFCSAMLVGYVMLRLRFQLRLLLIVTALLLVLRLPEAYGKNYVLHNVDYYAFTAENLHTTNFNPQWVGITQDYPIQSELISVVEGSAQVTVLREQSSSREYLVKADQDARLAFNTFYFPGWHIQVDGVEQIIEYQDPDYRGVMTLRLPSGEHRVDMEYRDTKTRLAAKAVSLAAAILIILYVVIHTRFRWKS